MAGFWRRDVGIFSGTLPLRREPGIDGRRHRENQLAGVPLAGVVPGERFAGRSDRGPDAGGDRDSRTDGDRPPRRLLAADRLFCLHRGIAGICGARQQSFPVLRRGFHHHADICRRPRADGRIRLARLSGAGDGAGAAGWRNPRDRQPVPAGLDRQSAVDAGDIGLPRRHLRAHPGVANARRARTANAGRADARAHRRAGAAPR